MMHHQGIAQKFSWFLYERGIGRAKSNFLFCTRLGSLKWLKVAETLMQNPNTTGRYQLLDQLLKPENFKSFSGRRPLLELLARFLAKGKLDEKRRTAEWVDHHSKVFTAKDEPLLAALAIGRYGSDLLISTASESALQKIRGRDTFLTKEHRLP